MLDLALEYLMEVTPVRLHTVCWGLTDAQVGRIPLQGGPASEAELLGSREL